MDLKFSVWSRICAVVWQHLRLLTIVMSPLPTLLTISLCYKLYLVSHPQRICGARRSSVRTESANAGAGSEPQAAGSSGEILHVLVEDILCQLRLPAVGSVISPRHGLRP